MRWMIGIISGQKQALLGFLKTCQPQTFGCNSTMKTKEKTKTKNKKTCLKYFFQHLCFSGRFFLFVFLPFISKIFYIFEIWQHQPNSKVMAKLINEWQLFRKSAQTYFYIYFKMKETMCILERKQAALLQQVTSRPTECSLDYTRPARILINWEGLFSFKGKLGQIILRKFKLLLFNVEEAC